ncbi:MAG: lipid II flippase MurJ, partial [Polyangiaceae bacterium]
GALAGGLLQVVAQWPALRSIGFADVPSFAFDDDVKQVLHRIAPLTLGIGIYSIDLVISRRFLSGLGPGAQSYFSWALRLCDFPQGIFVMALSTAALPALSTLAAANAGDEFARTWAHSMGLAMFVAVPTSVLLVVLAEPIVVTLFQRGAFDARAAHETARAVTWQGGAIWTVAAVRQTVPAMYALGDTRTPVLVSAVDLCAFILLAFFLRGPLGHVGVSVAVAGSSAVQMVLLLIGLRRRLAVWPGASLLRSMARTLVASGIAAAAGWGSARIVVTDLGPRSIARMLPGLAGGFGFVATFLLVAWGLQAPELDDILGVLRQRRKRGRTEAEVAR